MMPLEGIRILDMTRLAPGPYCSMLLADLGADVLVIEEAPTSGGRYVTRGPGGQEPAADPSRAYDATGRNKRSIALNLKTDQARQVFYRLAATADVVLEGFRPGVVTRLGVDYETLRPINPRLIYCSLSGYGQDGPYATLVGHDINYIAIGGALGLTGWPDTPPAIPMNIIADYAGGGLYAAFAILAALMARERTGRGQQVDMAMTDGVISLLARIASPYFATGDVPRPGKADLNGGVPHYNVYQTSDDKWISLGSREPWFFDNLCRIMGCEGFIPHQNDPQKHQEIFARFRQQFKTKTRDEWFQILSGVDICAAPVYSLDEVFADPHVQHRQMVIELEHPELGKVRQVGIAPKFSETPGRVRSLAPTLGQHTDEVLRHLGYSEQEIQGLRAAGAVA